MSDTIALPAPTRSLPPADQAHQKLAAAKALARRGFRMIRLAENTKLPLKDDNWTESATSDPAQLETLWSTDSPGGPIMQNYNYGILGGGEILIVDVDVKGGKPGIANFFALDGDFDTFTVRTPSGGYHLYYRTPYEVANSQGDRDGIALGIDGRGRNGYAVAPGSVVDGVEYTIEIDAPMAPVPAAILARCKPPGERIRDKINQPLVELDTPLAIDMATDVARRAQPGVTNQGHNDSTYALACKVRDCGVSEAVAVEIIDEHRNARSSPPLPREELASIIANAYAYGQNPEGWRHPAAIFAGVDVETPVYVAEPPAPVASGPAKKAMTPTPLDWSKMKDVPPRQWLYAATILRRYVSLVGAPGGVGKTAYAIGVGLSVAIGKALLGEVVHESCKVWIVNLEDGFDELMRRVDAAATLHKVTRNEIEGRLFIDSGRDAALCLADLDNGKVVIDDRAVESLIADIKSRGIGLTIVDPFMRSALAKA